MEVTGCQLLCAIRHGARVTIVNRFGQRRTGSAVMRAAPAAGPGAWVLNMGGAHGTPGIADERNVVMVSVARKATS